MPKPKGNREKIWGDWLKSRPPHVRRIAKNFKPWECYRSTKDRGHYLVYSFDENKDGTVTLKLIHGKDSFLPGFCVFAIKPETVILCGCGKIQPASKADVELSKARVETIKELHDECKE